MGQGYHGADIDGDGGGGGGSPYPSRFPAPSLSVVSLSPEGVSLNKLATKTSTRVSDRPPPASWPKPYKVREQPIYILAPSRLSGVRGLLLKYTWPWQSSLAAMFSPWLLMLCRYR